MLESRISRALLTLGIGVGVLGVGVWALDVSLLNLPDWVVRVAMLKLTLIASAGLLAGGALVGRHARRRERSGEADARQISEGSAQPIADGQGRITPQAVERGKSRL